MIRPFLEHVDMGIHIAYANASAHKIAEMRNNLVRASFIFTPSRSPRFPITAML